MFFWFVATAVFAVLFVFRDPAFDYRLVMVGSVLPLASVLVLHSVVFSIALLTVLILATSGRKPIRRMLLGLPVGTLLHLVFTGAWTNSKVFWWPLFGLDFEGARHPVAVRGLWNIPLELIGLALCWWIVARADLAGGGARRWLWQTGRLDLPAG